MSIPKAYMKSRIKRSVEQVAARQRQAQAARALKGRKLGVPMTDQPVPVAGQPDYIFTSLDDKIVPDDKCPTVREILIASVRSNPGAALQIIKACEAQKPEDRTPIGLNHTLNLGVPPALLLEAAEEMKAVAREALGL